MTLVVDDSVAPRTEGGAAPGMPDGAAAGAGDRVAAGVEDRMAAGADGLTDMVDGRSFDEPPDEQPPAKSMAATTPHTPTLTSGDFLVTSRDDLFLSLIRDSTIIVGK